MFRFPYMNGSTAWHLPRANVGSVAAVVKLGKYLQ